MKELKTFTTGKGTYDSFPDQTARSELPKKLTRPATAQVGDYLRITAIGADGTMEVEAVPPKVSAFENDAGYATEARVQELLAEFPSFEITVVQELPAVGAEKTIYLVPFADDSGSYLEYLWVNGTWEVIGTGKDSGANVDLTPELKTALIDYYTHVMPNFDDTNGLAYINAILTTLGAETRGEPEEPDTPVEPDTPEKTLTGISATYSGGDVAVGTAVADLMGIVVTAHYSDGSTEAVTGYTLSGTIAEGENTITVTYQGKTTTFTVTGVAESGGNVVSMDSWASVGAKDYDWSSDAGATVFSNSLTTRSGAYLLRSTNVFDTDTRVSIQMKNNGAAYDLFNIASLGQYNNMTYVESYGANAWASFDRTVEYTVKAGHYLAISSFASSTTVDITVTVLEDLGTGSAPVYTNAISEDDLNQIPNRVIPYANIYTDEGSTVTTTQSDMNYFTLPENGRYRITASAPTNETVNNFMAFVAVGTLNDDGTVYNAHYYATVGQNILTFPFYIDYTIGQIVMVRGNTDVTNAKKFVAHKL